ncbi:MAG TPA: hypothetical protein VHC39_00835 [Rhizomicrobium sp.]|nr:hypothetical protein [Rhizomicrobium sp.]
MAKSSPEKLADALRANLKRRKQAPAAKPAEPPPAPTAEPVTKPSKISD